MQCTAALLQLANELSYAIDSHEGNFAGQIRLVITCPIVDYDFAWCIAGVRYQ